MNFLRRVSSKLGLDGIKIDIIINNNYIEVGNVCNGILDIKGGSIKCKIGYVTLLINVEYEFKGNIESKVIQRIMIPVEKEILPRDRLDIPFSFVPFNEMPISVGDNSVWFSAEIEEKSKLSMLMAESKVFYSETNILNKNKDQSRLYIEILPHNNIKTVFNIIEKDLGFKIISTRNIFINNKEDKSKGIVIQKFICEPTNYFREKLNLLSISFDLQEDFLGLIMELDKKKKSIMEVVGGIIGIKGNREVIKLGKNDIGDIEYIKNKILYSLDKNINKGEG